MTILSKSCVMTGLILASFSVVRALLLARYWDIYQKKAKAGIAQAFLRGLRFDLSIVLTFCGLPILMLLLPVPGLPALDGGVGPWSVGWLAVMLLLGLLMLLLLTADLYYFGDVQRHIGNEILLLWDDRTEIMKMATGGYALPVAIFFVLVGALGWAWFWFARLPMTPVSHPGLVFTIVLLLVFFGVRGNYKGKSLNIIDAFRGGDTDLGNLSLNGVFTAYHASRASQLTPHRFMEDAEALEKTLEGLGGADRPRVHAEYPLLRAYEENVPNGHNLVFILLESWSRKYVDAFGGRGYGATPNLDRLAAEGIQFRRFHSVGQRSINAIQAVLSGAPVLPGLPQLGAGLESSNVLQLGHAAVSHGYRTLFVKSSKRRSFRVDSIAHSAGFQEYYGAEDMPMLLDYKNPNSSHFGWDYETLMFLKAKLDEGTGPFLGFTFTGTTHVPYPDLGPKFSIRPHAVDTENGFLNTLHYGDWSLGEFFKAAESEPWFDRTIFVMTADTTLGLFQSGEFSERFEVPLVLYAPKILKPGVVDTLGSQLDLLPTIYDLLGFQDPFTALGDSLFRKQCEVALFDQGGVLGLIGKGGYLRHSLRNRLEAVSLGADLSDADFDRMEELLLAFAQTSYRQLKSNRWFPQAQ
ncbi:MAG TPA: LTA synthase family protein [Geothrix sp.]|nr:LTA synthase family protein [Geothrix sp.]